MHRIEFGTSRKSENDTFESRIYDKIGPVPSTILVTENDEATTQLAKKIGEYDYFIIDTTYEKVPTT